MAEKTRERRQKFRKQSQVPESSKFSDFLDFVLLITSDRDTSTHDTSF